MCVRGSEAGRCSGVRMKSCHLPGCWYVSFIYPAEKWRKTRERRHRRAKLSVGFHHWQFSFDSLINFMSCARKPNDFRCERPIKLWQLSHQLSLLCLQQRLLISRPGGKSSNNCTSMAHECRKKIQEKLSPPNQRSVAGHCSLTFIAKCAWLEISLNFPICPVCIAQSRN